MEVGKELDYKNPVKLGLTLHLSVFYYEVLANPTEACKIAKETLMQAKEVLSGVDEEYKDSISIVNLLEENLNMWNMENDES